MCLRRHSWSWLLVVLFMVWSLLAPLGTPLGSVAPASAASTVANPDLNPTTCPLDVVLLLDESSSIRRSGYTQPVKDAVTVLLDQLEDTGSQLAIIEFSDAGRLEVDYHVVDAANRTAVFQPYLDTEYVPGGTTNWAHPLSLARDLNTTGPVADLLVLLGDGPPNRGGAWPQTALDAAVAAADLVKSDGTHIFGLGIKTLGWGATTFAPVFGPDAYVGPDLDNDDYVLQPNGYAVADTMTEVVESLCSGAAAGIDIQKLVSVDGGATYHDADAPPGPEVLVGGTVHFAFDLANMGAVELTNVGVTDSLFGPVCSGATMPPGAVLRCDPFSPQAVRAGLHANTATVTAMAGPVAVSDSDDAHYTGVLPGIINIGKQTDPPGGPAFEFTNDFATTAPTFTLIGGEFFATHDLFPGTYTVEEVNLPPGWTLESIECSGPFSTTNRVGNAIVIDLTEGDTVTCIFHNEQAATITVVKTADPADGTNFSFTTDIPAYSTFTLDDEAAQSDTVQNSITMSVPAGIWLITENHPLPDGWTLEPNVSCSTNAGAPWVSFTTNGILVNVAAGDDLTCTFANEGHGELTVAKQTEPPLPDGFEFSVIGEPGSEWLAHGESAIFELPPGSYSLTENVPAGWAFTGYSCNGTPPGGDEVHGPATVSTPPIDLAVGDDITCVFANAKTATITVEKAVEGTPNGDLFGFTFEHSTVEGFLLAAGQTWTSDDLLPGIYTVIEDSLPGYWALSDIDCGPAIVTPVQSGVTVNLSGEDVSCVFTNVEAALITIGKSASPPDGTDFTFTSDLPGLEAFALDSELNNTDGVFGTETISVPAGNYVITEDHPLPPGWRLDRVACDFLEGSGFAGGWPDGVNIEVTPGNVVECIFFNEGLAELTIVKEADPSDGTDFSFLAAGSQFELDDDDGADPTLPDRVTLTMPPGPVTVTEAVPGFWRATDVSCDDGTLGTTGVSPSVEVALDVGSHVTCTFTNALPSTVTFIKSAPEADPTVQFEFTEDITGSTHLITNGGVTYFSPVYPGMYTITDLGAPDYVNTSITCTDGSIQTPPTAVIEVHGGIDVECTFVNEPLPDEVDLILYKDGPSEVTASSLPFFPKTIEYVLTIVNDSSAAAGAVELSDTLPGGVMDARACVRINPSDCDDPIDFAPFASPIVVGTIPAGGAAQVLIRATVTAPVGSALENFASVSSAVADPDLANNADTLVTTVIAGLTNPDISNVCGNMIILLDESSSVRRAGATNQVRDGVMAILESVSGTGIHVAIIDFSDTATLVVPYTVVDPGTIAGDFTTYLTAGYSPGGTTNWAAAFEVAFALNESAGVASLVFGITDGNPNRPTGAAIPAAIGAADAVQAQGSHVFLGGIGYVAEANLVQVAGPNRWPGDTPGIGHADYFLVSNFPSFNAAIGDLTQQDGGICGGSVSVIKHQELAPGTSVYELSGGWEFAATPAAAVPVYASPPSGTTAGTTGAANFSWDTTVTGDVTITETPKDRFVIESVLCVRSSGNQVGQTFDSFSFETTVPVHDRVTCEVHNRYAAEIWGYKFHDVDGNTVDEGEPRVAGVQINLTGIDWMGRPVALVTTTGPDGVYGFTHLQPGTYTVTETPPVGSAPSTVHPIPITVTWGDAMVANDSLVPYWTDLIGELGIGNTWFGSIHGYKFHDLNGNGVDDNEPRLAGVDIEIDGATITGVPVSWSTVTGPDGEYAFGNLWPGSYVISERIPPGFEATTPTSVLINIISGEEAMAEPGQAILLPGQFETINSGLAFGNTMRGSIHGYKFEDLNANGLWDDLEPPVLAHDIMLTGDDGTSISVPTNTDGEYTFEDLWPGVTYEITEVIGASMVQTTLVPLPIHLLSGFEWVATPEQAAALAVAGHDSALIVIDPDLAFGNALLGSIHGYKFEDVDVDGIWDSTEPALAGVAINLSGDDGSTALMTTGPDGAFAFEDLVPGVDYTVTETVPAGMFQTTPNPGPIFIRSGVEWVATNEQADELVAAGQPPDRIIIDPDLAFGNAFFGSIHGLKFEDLNGNGIFDSGEPGLGGVQIHISGDDGTSDTVTTGSAGTYAWVNLLPGVDYTITETVPAGMFQTTPNPGPIFIRSGVEWVATNEQADELVAAGQPPDRIIIDPDLAFGNAFFGSIHGLKFEDIDGDGLFDSGEPGLGGVQIHISGDDGTSDTVTTGSAGTYAWVNLLPGVDYTITETVPAGMVQSTTDPAPIFIRSGVEWVATQQQADELVGSGHPPDRIIIDPDLAFGNLRLGSIHGLKFHDIIGNGIIDTDPDYGLEDPPLPGITIELTGDTDGDGTPETLTTTTDDDGEFGFDDLWPGPYTVTENLPVGSMFFDPFEGTAIDPRWTTINQDYGSVALSTDQAFEGDQSLRMQSASGGNRNMSAIHELPELGKGTVSAQFYDSAPGTHTLYAFLDTWDQATPGTKRGVGIVDHKGDFYWANNAPTSVPRTLGWHLFEIVYEPGRVDIFIDNTLVSTELGDFTFDRVAQSASGPSWRPNATYYWDDFRMRTCPEQLLHCALVPTTTIPTLLTVHSGEELMAVPGQALLELGQYETIEPTLEFGNTMLTSWHGYAFHDLDGDGWFDPGGVTEVLDATTPMEEPRGIAVDAHGNVYFSSSATDQLLIYSVGGAVWEIIGPSGDGTNPLDEPQEVQIDLEGNVYVTGYSSDNVFRYAPDGTISLVIGPAGDGTNPLDGPHDMAIDAAGNVYVAAEVSDNAFKITPGGAITQLISAAHGLNAAYGIVVASDGDVYVTGITSDDVYKITPAGAVTKVLDWFGDGTNRLNGPTTAVIDAQDNVYVTTASSQNVWRIAPGGAVTELMDTVGDGVNEFLGGFGIALDSLGNLYVTSHSNGNVFKRSPGGTVTRILDGSGDGAGNSLVQPYGIDVDPWGNVYVAGFGSDNLFRIGAAEPRIPGLSVSLLPDSPPVPIGQVTDANGEYGLTDLWPGDYTITTTPLPGWVATNVDAWGWHLTSGQEIVAEFGQSGVMKGEARWELRVEPDAHFGSAVLGSIHGYVYEDVNGNGRDDGEPRISGLTIVLTGDVDGDHNVDTVTATTNASGEYGFTNVWPGVHTVSHTPPAGRVATTLVSRIVTLQSMQELVAVAGQAELPAGSLPFEVVVGADLAFGLSPGPILFWDFEQTSTTAVSSMAGTEGTFHGAQLVDWSPSPKGHVYRTRDFGTNRPYLEVTSDHDVVLTAIEFEHLHNHNPSQGALTYQVQLQVDMGSGYVDIGDPFEASKATNGQVRLLDLGVTIVVGPGTNAKIRWENLRAADTNGDYFGLNDVTLFGSAGT